MKNILFTFILGICCTVLFAQIDPSLLKRIPVDTGKGLMNMDAVYNRPFLQVAKIPVSIGGYAETNYQYFSRDGISERHQFQMRRFTLFVSSSIFRRIKFLAELEFEGGTKEINLEFAAVDIEAHPLLNFRGGVIMNPIGAFNQNHDGPKWEFIDRPMAATQMLPATWSNVGFGIYGKKYNKNWVYAYEAYITNGFDDKIISNGQNRTSLAATKQNMDRFEESFNGSPLFTVKAALKHQKVAEVGISFMSGVYNKFKDDGIVLDKKRRLHTLAIDMNTKLPKINTTITAEWAWVYVDVPPTYTQQYGSRQQGGFIDIVQPVYSSKLFGFKKSVVNIALRLEYVDWNVGYFTSTGGRIRDEFYSIVPAISWRPIPQTVIRFNYRYNWEHDILGNPPSRVAGFQIGFSSYF